MRIWFVCVHSDRALFCGCLNSRCVLCAIVLPCLLFSGICLLMCSLILLVLLLVGVRVPLENAEMGKTLV